jgi:hypothetical protein
MMHKIFSLLLIIPHILFAQQAVISPEELSVVYVGLKNPLKMAISGVSLENTIAKTSFGNLVKTDSVYFLEIPTRITNELTVSLGYKNNDDTVWVLHKKFRIINVPKATPRLGALGFVRPMDIPALRVQSRIIAFLENFIYSDVRVIVKSYTAFAVSKKLGVVRIHSKNSSLAPLQSYLSKMTSDDLIIFDSVEMIAPVGIVYYGGPYVAKFNGEKKLNIFVSTPNGLQLLSDVPNYFRNISASPAVIKFINMNTLQTVTEYQFNISQNKLLILDEYHTKGFGIKYSEKDSMLTITRNDTVSMGKAIPASAFLIPKKMKELNTYSHVRSDTIHFLYRHWYNPHTELIPIGKWISQVNGKAIASGTIQYSSTEIKSTHTPTSSLTIFIPDNLSNITYTYRGNYNDGFTSTLVYLDYGEDFMFHK